MCLVVPSETSIKSHILLTKLIHYAKKEEVNGSAHY